MQTRHKLYMCPARSAAGSADSISEDRPRDDMRVPMLPIAAMAFGEGPGGPWCSTVRDRSHGGARLELDREVGKPPRVSEELPDHITLYFCPEQTEVGCRVAWRDGRHFGVQFTDEIRPSTRRPV